MTGTLLIDGGDLPIKEWKDARRRRSHHVAISRLAESRSGIRRPKDVASPCSRAKAGTSPSKSSPASPPRVADRTVAVSWQSGASTSTSIAEFHFRRPREFPATSAANACHVRLNPLVSCARIDGNLASRLPSVPSPGPLARNLRPVPRRVYEILTGGDTSPQLLAVDANGDGSLMRRAMPCYRPRQTGFPEVAFAPEKPVAALELRLFPLPSSTDRSLRRSTSPSRSATAPSWRVPPDVDHRVKTR